ncbi:MAG: hypothetical protein IK101_07720 [Oscillospiraceae bacterium]|nr:hypothetical protein [Oscillospiraceae bacterium]
MNDKLYKDTFSRLRTTVDETEIAVPRRRYRAVTVAVAAVLVLALAVGAAAVTAGSGRLHDLVIKSTPAPEALSGEAEQAEPSAEAEPHKTGSYDPLPAGVDMISLQGYADSPEYKAMQEWSQFEHEYDLDGSVLAKVGNDPTPWDEKYNYNGYLIYSQEMADKLDEIAEKYGLVLHSGGNSWAGADELKAMVGDFTDIDRMSGYRYSDGTFGFDSRTDLEGCGEVWFQLHRSMKGVLDTVGLNIFDASQYVQWEYETACGKTVLLALGPDKALIFSDSEKSFVVVNVLSGSSQGVTQEALERFADRFDFSML